MILSDIIQYIINNLSKQIILCDLNILFYKSNYMYFTIILTNRIIFV